MRVYQIFDKKNHEGKYYKEWDLPDGFPIPQGYIFIPPNEELSTPKFNLETNMWEESKEDLLCEILGDKEELKKEVTLLKEEKQKLMARTESLEDAFIDLLMMTMDVQELE